ncbi:autotransporter domain-containing protein [Labrys sp. LIt4]|uniref:autotransporter domain-containing protein n=1 Tax=Labrys sp. LIt4 TaxID=2821355 RepID=UPI001ADFF011|nr:autotransporter domain-containing protein [Labrys sp. LIt4]MBP0582911.1 autotransporter domain-containing protein [Labrys sp. LIt4]
MAIGDSRREWRLGLFGIGAHLLSGVALCTLASTPSLAQDDGTLRIMTLNIWNQFKQNPEVVADFMTKVNFDVLGMQEVNGSKYVSDIPGFLEKAGLGTYGKVQIGDVGIISRLPGSFGTYVLPGISTQGRNISYTIADQQGGRPQTVVGTVHLDYADGPQGRVKEAQALNEWAKTSSRPVILMGDFNAGDVAERGLMSAAQQSYFYAGYVVGSYGDNALYKKLRDEYLGADQLAKAQAYFDDMRSGGKGKEKYRSVIQAYFDANRSKYPGITNIGQMSWRQWEEIIALDAQAKGITFKDETYPVADNQPVTMNVLKKQYMLLQTEAEREHFKPHDLNDGSSTWPSAGEDDTNTWASWDRTKIDHFLASRPFGKWYVLADDPNDPYSGVIKDVYVTKPDGTKAPISDHEPVAHNLKWIGPALESYTETAGGKSSDKTRLVWGEQANTFAKDGKEFFLTRNNMRRDIYLGQISDANGNPILAGLTEEEKKTLLDCASKDPRFQQAIQEYCIDDHSFIGETLVKDKGVLIVEEDAALGTSQARLRLADGTLRIIGDDMHGLDRALVLEGVGGSLDVASAGNAVTLGQAITGEGGLTKLGAGGLRLTGTGTYAGPTLVKQGTLVVDGSLTSTVTVDRGAALGGSGAIGGLEAKSGSLVTPTGAGVLTVKGDARFSQGSYYQVDVGAGDKADKIAVTGKATLDGGTVLIGAQGGNSLLSKEQLLSLYGKEYTILTAEGGVSGRFEGALPDYAFLGASFGYDPTEVTMTIGRNGRSFASVGQTVNQRAAAAGLESLGRGNALFDDFLVANAGADLAGHLASLSGEVNVSTRTALIEGDSQLSAMATDRLRSAFETTAAAGLPATGAGTASAMPMQFASLGASNTPEASASPAALPAAVGLSVWGQGFGSWGRSGSTGNAAGMTRNSGGFLVGADTPVALGETDVRLGALAGYSRTSFSTRGLGSGDSDNYHLGLYAGTMVGQLALRAGAFYTWHDISTGRVAGGQGVSADYRAGTAQVFGEAGYNLRFGAFGFEPFANFTFLDLNSDGFHEHGGNAALAASSSTTDVTFGTLGLRASTAFELASLTARLSATLGWRHAFGDTTPVGRFAFDGGTPFGVEGVPIAEDALVAKAGLDLALSQSATLSVAYGGQFARRGSFDQNVSGKFSWRF